MEEREDEEVGSEEKMVTVVQEYGKLLQHKVLEKTITSQYCSWAQVGGYFDGDGTVGLDVQLFTLGLYLEFTDNWFAQLTMLKNFFDKSGVITYLPSSNVRNGAYTLKVLRILSVIDAAKKMLPHVWKKQLELKTILDYYEGRITGQGVVEIFNHEVSARKRTGKLRVVRMPYTYEQGRKLALEFTGRLAAKANKVEVPAETQRAIVRDYQVFNMSQHKLADTYGLSRTVVRRILGVN